MTAFLSQTFLPALFNMSLTAGIVILCVIVARLFLKRAPKIFSYALWAVVLFRLLCPVSLPSAFSLLGALDAPAKQASPVVSTVTYVQPPQPVGEVPQSEPLPSEPDTSKPDPVTPVTPEASVDWSAVAAWVWLAGAAGMAGYSIFALIRLHRRLVGSLHLRDNLYLADHISTPFVLGLVRPKIYLPSTLTEGEMGYIIRHEQYHIRHLDHVVKVVAFAALCLHWFNPLVWVAFVLAGKDMEMRCDEAVVKELGENVKADYSASLLTLATGRLTIAGTPLAFGEGDPKGRIRNLLRWKRPRVWLSAVACIACVAVIAACASNPAEEGRETPIGNSGPYRSMEDFAQKTMEQVKEVTYYRYSNETVVDEEATAQVTGTKVAWLEKQGELEGLAPEGTLEAWTFNYLVQLDVPTEDVALVGGMSEEDGWFDLEGQGGHNIVALRYPDGSYNVLYDQPVNDNGDFLGYHNSYEEAIYDWYVIDQGLDLPLYVEDWSDQVTYPGTYQGTLPVHRYDGDGWYLYVPVMAWEQYKGDGNNWEWQSEYRASSTILKVNRITSDTMDVLPALYRQAGYEPVDENQRVWKQESGFIIMYRYLVDGANGQIWEIDTCCPESKTDDYPYIAIEPQVLQLMAESFRAHDVVWAAEVVEPESVTQAKTDLKLAVEGEMELIHRTGSSVQGLVVNPEVLSVLSGLNDLTWEVVSPEWYIVVEEDWPQSLFTRPNTVSVILDQEQGWGFCFWLMTDSGTNRVRVDYGVDGKATTFYLESGQLYLYLMAVQENPTVELHDLDDDGVYEAVAWPTGEKRKLMIYDYYEDELHKIDIAQEVGAEFADYTGLMGNIQREYSNMVEADVDGEDGIYQYKDGTLTYVCTLEEALRKL